MLDRTSNKYYECPDYIRYLCQEGIRKGAHQSPSFYSEIIKFAQSHEGKLAYQKFITINPNKLGIYSIRQNQPKRISLP
jgi:hypothetical protein